VTKCDTARHWITQEGPICGVDMGLFWRWLSCCNVNLISELEVLLISKELGSALKLDF
jgi:hypothetical protein